MKKIRVDLLFDTNPVTVNTGFLAEGNQLADVFQKIVRAKENKSFAILLKDFEDLGFLVDPERIFSINISFVDTEKGDKDAIKEGDKPEDGK